MTIIITMAGKGIRFYNAGFTTPKHEIKSMGKSLFEWSLRSFADFTNERFIFITRKGFYNRIFIEGILIKLGIDNFEIVELQTETSGQAETAMALNDKIDNNEQVIIFNIDTYVEPGNIKKTDFMSKYEGVIHVFKAPGDRWSFIKLNDDGVIVEVTEKIRVSDLASIGLYFFAKWSIFTNAYFMYHKEVIKKYGESYIAPLYNYLLSTKKIGYMEIESDKVHILGTPEDLNVFEKNCKEILSE